MTRKGKAFQIAVYVFASFGLISLVMLVVGIAYSQWMRRNMVYPSVANESVFIQNYKLRPAVEPFISPAYGWSMSGPSVDGSSGTRVVHHGGTTILYFVVQPERWTSLMSTAGDDVKAQLAASGARITTQAGSPSTDLHYGYILDHSVGSVTINKARPARVKRNLPLAMGLEDAAIEVAIDERWFASGAPKP